MNKLNEETLKKLSNSITNIIDAEGKQISFINAELKYNLGYWTQGKETLSLFLDGVKCQVTNTKVSYKCSCGQLNTILLKKFLLKTKLSCAHCSETKEKREHHSMVLKAKKKGIDLTKKKTINTVYDFESESEDFKKSYWDYRQNLTHEEFDEVLKYIYSIDGVVLTDSSDIEYLPTEPCKNQKKYTPMVIINGKKHGLKDIFLKCPFCGNIFRISRGFKDRLKYHHYICKECCFVNKTFKIKKYNDNLFYQSQKELEFIEKCVENNIDITNGPKIPYTYKSSTHCYKVDFKLPYLKLLVEIKDEHIWHKQQVENGKWRAKEMSALKYCEQNGLKFILLFPKNFDNFFKTIERDSLNCNESYRG